MKVLTLRAAPAALVGFLIIVSAVSGSGPAAAATANGVTDSGVTEAVIRELQSDPGVSAHQIVVSAVDGTVSLSGRVGNLLEKRRAAEIARTVRGVSDVDNALIVPTTPESSGAIERQVREALEANPATAKLEVAAKVDTLGAATLTGTVDSWQQRELVESVAASVRGVTGIENSIDVKAAIDRSDTEIGQEIRQTFRWDALLADALVTATVDDGHVTLAGTVGSAAERRRAYAKAWTAGVHSVDISELDVRRWTRAPELVGDKYGSRRDSEIEEAVERALLYRPSVLSASIDVLVDGGVATLRGEVGSLGAKREAEQAAANVVGVRRVRNYLIVESEDTITDADIAAAVRDALERSPYVEQHDVSVRVSLGVARLGGTADT